MGILDNLKTELGKFIVNKAKENIKKRSYGRRYFYNGRVHIASKPNHPPNIRSGALYRTVKYRIKGNTVIVSEGSNSVNYATYLELGTRKMQPRPNLFNILEKEKREINNILEKEINLIIKRKFGNARNFKI